MAEVLIGNYTARFDASGRIKIPEKFREAIQASYGKDLFVTSLTDESVQIYPLSVWLEMTGMTSEGAVHLRPDVRKFMLRVNRNGSRHELDSKGRVLINQTLRDKARLQEEVEVIGLSNHLEVWNKDALDGILEEKPLSDADFENIARLIPRGKTE
ncbi:MAG: division/cell wall cluster transcriptional repressor MraZ [Candidatus Aminicenantales bacterium]